ncbi:unnamed protein product [Gadus morhua 'NCC']
MFGVYRGYWDVIKDNMFKDLSITIFIIIFIIIIIHIPGPITMTNGMSAGWYPILTTLLVLITHTHTHIQDPFLVSHSGAPPLLLNRTIDLHRWRPVQVAAPRPRHGAPPTSRRHAHPTP